MSIFYRKYQNKNHRSPSYGKWFGRAVVLGKTVTLEDLAEHIGKTYKITPFHFFIVSLQHKTIKT